jgi:hypothetical protein
VKVRHLSINISGPPFRHSLVSGLLQCATSHEMSSEAEKEELQTADAVVLAPEFVDDDTPPNGGYGWVICFVRISHLVFGIR